MRIRASDRYGIDHDVNDSSQRKADTIELVAAFEDGGVFYANVSLNNKGAQQCALDSGWLKFSDDQAENAVPEQVSDHEWRVPIEAAADMGGEWRRYQIDLADAVARSFGEQGCAFAGLQTYRIRGDMDIERIAAYDRQP